MSLKDQIKIPVKCAKCGKETTRSLASLQRSKIVRCSGCGINIEVKMTGDKKIVASLDKLEKTIKGLGGKFK